MSTDDPYDRAEKLRTARQAVADFDFGDFPTYSDSWWQERDREVAELRAKDAAKAEQLRMIQRSGELKDNGFPSLFIEAALATELDTQAMRHARHFVYTPRKVLILAGGVGAGKTTAAVWVGLKGQDLRPGFIRTGEIERRGRYDKQLGQWLEDKTSLVIDDLGTEVLDGKGVFRSLLEEVVDMFYGDRRTLVITTNLRPKQSNALEEMQFKERYGDRVWSRVVQTGVWGDCGTTDLRKVQAQ